MFISEVNIITSLIFDIGLTLGVGSSTFALIFFIRALEDGTIDQLEKRFMHTVYFVLRIGMILIGIGLLATLLTGQSLPFTQYAMQWTLLAVVTINALLMTWNIMPMTIGPVLAGGSWYALFLVTSLPIAPVSYMKLLVYYALFLVVFFVVWTMVKKKFLLPRN
jgi:hypothetical protein